MHVLVYLGAPIWSARVLFHSKIDGCLPLPQRVDLKMVGQRLGEDRWPRSGKASDPGCTRWLIRARFISVGHVVFRPDHSNRPRRRRTCARRSSLSRNHRCRMQGAGCRRLRFEERSLQRLALELGARLYPQPMPAALSIVSQLIQPRMG